MNVIEEIKKDIKDLFYVQDGKEFIKRNIPYLVFFYLGERSMDLQDGVMQRILLHT